VKNKRLVEAFENGKLDVTMQDHLREASMGSDTLRNKQMLNRDAFHRQ
jgi:hypothetical protein